jgi:hypothetical protein
MSERNEQMARLLMADAPAARDLSFEIALLARIEQRRFRRGLAMTMLLAAASAILLALLMPGFENIWQQRYAGAFSNGMIAAMPFAVLLPMQVWIMRRA